MDFSNFWSITLGQLITVGSILATLIKLHKDNQKTIREDADRVKEESDRIERMEMKLNTVYDWFVKNVINR